MSDLSPEAGRGQDRVWHPTMTVADASSRARVTAYMRDLTLWKLTNDTEKEEEARMWKTAHSPTSFAAYFVFCVSRRGAASGGGGVWDNLERSRSHMGWRSTVEGEEEAEEYAGVWR